LRAAGLLRIENKQASLEELGQMHEPPLTKDAVAGRIRRLLATADKRAAELGVPNTEASLSAEMLDEEQVSPGQSCGQAARPRGWLPPRKPAVHCAVEVR